jgi:putative glycosyltransferase (TIGR04372 family)
MIIDYIFHKINSSKSHPYFYLSPHVYGFGNCAEQIFAGLIRAKHETKKLVILYPFDIPFIFKYKLTNRALFNLKSDLIVDQGKYVTLLSRTLMTIVYMPLRVAGLLLRKFSKFNLPESYHFPSIGYRDIFVPEKSVKEFSLKSLQKYNWSEKLNQKIDFTIRLNGNVHDGYEHHKIGVPENSWFVCLHVRGSGFYNDKDRRGRRNSNIENYIPAIKDITLRGGWVVRLGDNSMTPLPSMDNVIDYPFTKYKSDFMDLCLIKNCMFFIASHSGPLDLAKCFGKNILITNMFQWSLDPARIRDRGILKHVYSKKDQRYLSIRELLTREWGVKSLDPSYGVIDEDNYTVSDNSKEEISRAVLEYMDFLSNNDLSLTSKQQEFIKYRKIQSHRVIQSSLLNSPRTHTDEDKMIYLYKLKARLESAQGTLCAGFLEENW